MATEGIDDEIQIERNAGLIMAVGLKIHQRPHLSYSYSLHSTIDQKLDWVILVSAM